MLSWNPLAPLIRRLRRKRADSAEGADLRNLQLEMGNIDETQRTSETTSPQPGRGTKKELSDLQKELRAGDKVVSFKLDTPLPSQKERPSEKDRPSEKRPSDEKRSAGSTGSSAASSLASSAQSSITPGRYSGDGWQVSSEAVRDVQRQQGKSVIPRTATAPVELKPAEQADASVGHARDLAQPGGFRRAHVLSQLGEGETT